MSNQSDDKKYVSVGYEIMKRDSHGIITEINPISVTELSEDDIERMYFVEVSIFIIRAACVMIVLYGAFEKQIDFMLGF